MLDKKHYITLDNAVGSIEASQTQQFRFDELTWRISRREFHVPVLQKIVCVCIDGRLGGQTGPCSAGGSFSLTVADDLTTQRFTKGSSLIEADRRVLTHLKQSESEVGGHSAGPTEFNCGCGAKDKLAAIYTFIVDNPGIIRAGVESLGIQVSDDVHELILGRAESRTDFPSGVDLSRALKEVAGEEAEATLLGVHKEVVAAVNYMEGTSLDRDALVRAFEGDYQAFNIDAWAFEDSAAMISVTVEEAMMKVIALGYYNLATAHVLCGPGMRVVPVRL